MTFPSEQLRWEVADLLRDPEKQHQRPEELAEQALQEISKQLDHLNNDEIPQSAQEAFAVADAWASLVSFVVGSVYAPRSPLRWPGWSSGVASALSLIVDLLRRYLRKVVDSAAPTGWAISVGFPWGVSIEVSWSLPLGQ